MICTCIAEPTVEKCLAVLREFEFAEIRLDRMAAEPEDLKRIFSLPKRLVATCRPGGMESDQRKALLTAAVESGAAFIDIELDAEAGFRHNLIATARKFACQVIISYHNHVMTPGKPELEQVVDSCFKAGADIAKIACLALSPHDNVRLLAMLEEKRPLIVTGMGEKGKISRIIAPLLGSCFAYASPAAGRETAPGQIDTKTLGDLLYRIENV